MNREEKLHYLLENYMSATDVTHAFGFKSNTMISNMRRGQTNISTLHIEGLERHFKIPQKVFSANVSTEEEIDLLIKTYQIREKEEKKKANFNTILLQKLEASNLIPKDIFTQNFETLEEIDELIKQQKEHLMQENRRDIFSLFSQKIFPQDEKLFNKLKGVWYGYVYPSNPASAKHGIWEVETTIHDDYSVVDYWGNAGYLKIGKNESLIIKESYDHDDLTVIRFSNRQVPSEIFRFVIVSNQNHTLHEMVNFGFFSRKQYDLEEAKEILGNRENKQLKLDIEFNEKLIQRAIVPQ